MSVRPIELTVGNQPGKEAVMQSYPFDDGKTYLMPMYALTVAGKDDGGAVRTRVFDVLRFGVKRNTVGDAARVVGLADAQTHIIKTWDPTYIVHSAPSAENGAWQVYDNFLIHDGPDDPTRERFGSIGCVEICRGPQGFVGFNDFLISLSGSVEATRDKKLADIGKSGVMKITYLLATRPPLKSQ